MKKRVVIPVILLMMLGVFLALNYRTIHMIVKNATVAKLPDPVLDDWMGGETYAHVPYAGESDAEYVNIYVPEVVKHPVLFVLIHGGGFIAGEAETRQTELMIDYFRDRGYACASVNYRLAQEAGFPGAVDDCKAAIRFLKANAGKYGYSAEKVAVFGESAGGYLALMCAVTSDDDFSGVRYIGQGEEETPSARVDKLVDYYGYTSLTGLTEDLRSIGVPRFIYSIANSWMNGHIGGFEDFGSFFFRKNVSGMEPTERKAFDPYYYLEKNQPDIDVYLIHGDCDLTIPLPSSERLFARLSDVLGEKKVSFRVEPGMGHASDGLYADDILSEIDQFLSK